MPRRRRYYIPSSAGFGGDYDGSDYNNLSVQDEAPTEGVEDATENEETVDVWSSYQCKSIPYGIPHPGDIVEAGSLSTVSLPANSYPLSESLRQQIDEGTLSSMQLEGIMYACERHSRRLPDGRRAGFFVGDSAGVGKGRQMAGIILDNLLRGRKRHVWFSASKDLHLDATRDLRDIGCTVQVFDSVASLGRKLKSSPVEEAVVFCTYNELISPGSRDTKLTRFDELLRWLCNGSTISDRSSFDGVIVFDECHKAKNYFEGKGAKNSSKSGNAVVLLQDQLPDARIVYSSATGISAVENMGYMARMGLWGDKTSFQNFEEFSSAIGGGKSVAALEMLALEFKATGCQVARNVGYHGAEFSTVSANLSPNDAMMYRAAAELLRDIHDGIIKSFEICRKTPNGEYRDDRPGVKGLEGNAIKMFWSSHQRFMRQLIAALKVPALAQVANESLNAGYCVVIGLQTTGEASLGRALEDELEEYGMSNVAEESDEDDQLTENQLDFGKKKRTSVKKGAGKGGQVLNSRNGELVSICYSILKSFLVKWFPVKQLWSRLPTDPLEVPYLPDRNDLCVELWLLCRDVPSLDAKMFIPKILQYLLPPIRKQDFQASKAVPAYDREGTVIESKRMQQRLLARLNNIYLPPSALDDLIDRLGGPSSVAEMTGRGIRQIRLEDGTVAVQSRVKISAPKGSRKPTNDLVAWSDTERASLNVQERGAFMRGEKLVAIISEAASTGISLHADRTALNQKRRVHCTLELPWAADQAIQQLGRSHRTNQSSAPIFRLLSSGLGGEHRFIASVSRRLQSLGALTQGDRRASVGAMTFGEFQYESDHGRNALKTLYESVMKGEVPSNVDWRDILQQSWEHIKLDFGESPDDPEDDENRPRVIAEADPAQWCPPINPRIKSEREFLDALEEGIKFTGGLKHTTELEEIYADRFRSSRRARDWKHLYGTMTTTTTTQPRKRLVPIDPKSFNQNITKDVPRFFNRILGLPFGYQALLFNYFNALLEEDIKEAKRNGKFDRGVQILDGQNISRTSPPQLIYRDPGTGGKLTIHALSRDRGVTLKDIIRELRYRSAALYNPSVKREDFPLVDPPTPQSLAVALNEAGDNGCFFRSKKEIFGRHRICLAIRLGVSQWKVIRPGTGIFSASQMTDDVLQRNYTVITNFERIRVYWEEEFEWSEKECTHGRNCKVGALCTVGKRKFDTNILTGNVISLWSSLERLIENVQTLPKCERTMSIVQTNITASRERVVGVIWPQAAVPVLHEMVKTLKHKHDVERRSVVVRNLPLTLPVRRPPSNMLYDGQRELYLEKERLYQQWVNTRPSAYEQLAMIGFAINNNGVVEQVNAAAHTAGVKEGYTLFKVGYYDIESSRAIGDLKRVTSDNARTYDGRLHLDRCTFLRPFCEQDRVDDERLWNEGLSREPATPVDPAAIARLLTDPKTLRIQYEPVADTPCATAAVSKKRSTPSPEELLPRKTAAVAEEGQDDGGLESKSSSGRSSRRRTPVDYCKIDGGPEDTADQVSDSSASPSGSSSASDDDGESDFE